MTEVTGLLQIGLAQDGEPALAQDRLTVSETVLKAVPHSPRFSSGDAAVQWLITADSDQLTALLGQVRAAWDGSGTYLSWRPLGPSQPVAEVTAPAASRTRSCICKSAAASASNRAMARCAARTRSERGYARCHDADGHGGAHRPRSGVAAAPLHLSATAPKTTSAATTARRISGCAAPRSQDGRRCGSPITGPDQQRSTETERLVRRHNTMRKPNGRRWMALRQAVFATYGRTCHICGHGGASQVDHVIPQAVAPQLAWEISNCRPAHGVPGNKCPTCGVACNQSRQAGVIKPKPAATVKQAPAATTAKQATAVLKPGGQCTPYCEGLAGHPYNCGRRW